MRGFLRPSDEFEGDAMKCPAVAEILQPILDIASEVIAGRGGLITRFGGDEIIALSVPGPFQQPA